MAGIYIHIPFCRQKCYYCDFYSVASLKHATELQEMLCEELQHQKNYLQGEKVESIYIGGGSPSVLSPEEITKIIKKVYQLHKVEENAEITLEANPDDLTYEYLDNLFKTPVNRLSVGIQSFSDDDLRLMNRRHTAKQAIETIKYAQKIGFKNISIDLIYGLPDMSTEKWKKHLNQAFELNVQHISSYHLTYEPRTVFAKMLKMNKIQPIEEDSSYEQFLLLRKMAKEAGFIHYEISNFAKPNFLAIHNTNYWKQVKYLGIGPSAHSYDGENRQWNISHIPDYMKSMRKGKIPCETEILSKYDKYNDYIMTSLRTIWGIDLNYINEKFGKELLNKCLKNASPFIKKEMLVKKDNFITLGDNSWFVADKLISELFEVE